MPSTSVLHRHFRNGDAFSAVGQQPGGERRQLARLGRGAEHLSGWHLGAATVFSVALHRPTGVSLAPTEYVAGQAFYVDLARLELRGGGVDPLDRDLADGDGGPASARIDDLDVRQGSPHRPAASGVVAPTVTVGPPSAAMTAGADARQPQREHGSAARREPQCLAARRRAFFGLGRVMDFSPLLEKGFSPLDCEELAATACHATPRAETVSRSPRHRPSSAAWPRCRETGSRGSRPPRAKRK